MAVATRTALAEWVKIFSRQAVDTYTGSSTFMKQLTVVAVSAITYLKNVFPVDSYTVEVFGGISLRILKKKCNDELAQFLSTALSRAFEAFNQKYLHQLVLSFYDTECSADNLVENHVFEYTYNPDGASMSVQSSRPGAKHASSYTLSNVRERTLHLLKACIMITEACQSVPQSYAISLRLFYNENAPDGYQAPGFVPTDDVTELECEQLSLQDTVRIGAVKTPFHSVTLRANIKDTSDISHDVIPSQNPPIIVLNDEQEFDISSPSTSKLGSEDKWEIRCPCNRNYDDDATFAFIRCQYCNTMQHAACFGIRRERAERLDRHCCTICYEEDPSRTPTDRKLVSENVVRKECLCIFRCTLEWMSQRAALSVLELAQQFSLSGATAAKLMKQLHSHGIIEQGVQHDLVSPRRVKPEYLQEAIKKHFNEDDVIVDDLVEEALLSQGSQHDVVRDVLEPMERVSLQNAATFYKVIEPLPAPTVEDATLKLYRDAVMANEQVVNGVPLSGSHNPVDVENIGVKRKINLKSGAKIGVRSKKSKRE